MAFICRAAKLQPKDKFPPPCMPTRMSDLPKSSPSLHLLTPPFLVFLAQYPSDYRLPSTLFSGTGTSSASTAAAAHASAPDSTSDTGISKVPDFLGVARTEGEITVLYSISLDTEIDSEGKESDEELEVRRRKTLGALGLDEPRESDGPYAAIRVQGPLNLSKSTHCPALRHVEPKHGFPSALRGARAESAEASQTSSVRDEACPYVN